MNAAIAVKSSALFGAMLATQAAVTSAIAQHENVILGVRQPVLMVAIVGALVGVLLLSPNDIASGVPQTGSLPRRALTVLLRTGSLGIFVFAFALLSAWSVEAACIYFPSLDPAAVPIAGIAGAFIKRLLPIVIRGVERRTQVIADGGTQP